MLKERKITMFDFENKPVKDWTLAEAKEYCKYKNKNNECMLIVPNTSCKLLKCNLCCNKPKNTEFNTLPKFTPDEIAFCRLIKKTTPWVNYIARSSMSLMYLELQPVFSDYGCFDTGRTGYCTKIDVKFFPQIKPLTYYAIDDIIKQGENNNA